MSLKRKRNNSIFVSNDDITYELTYNYRNYKSLSEDVVKKIDSLSYIIVNEVNKEIYNTSIEHIKHVSSLTNERFCGKLAADYNDYYYKKSDAVIQLFKDGDILVGYSFINFNSETQHILINLICGNKKYKNVGTLILDNLYTIGKAIGYKKLTLTSTTEALPFYLKKKFECIQEQCPRELDIKQSGGKRKRKRTRTTRKRTST